MRRRVTLFVISLKNNPISTISASAIVLIIAGLYLLFKAHSLSWPRYFEYMGSPNDTSWGRLEAHLNFLAYYFVGLGTTLLLIATFYRLSDWRQRRSNLTLISTGGPTD